MITLGLETSTSRGSVAILDGPLTLFNETFSAERGHSAQLFASIQRALAVARPEQIAAGLGPGSYSGVRIAISAAIGLGLATGAALVGVPSILALETAAVRYRAIGDARRESFYFAEIKDRECAIAPRLMTREELKAILEDGACAVFSSAPIEAFPAAELAFPAAEILARLASAGRGIIARERLEPLYLRDPHITTPRAPA